MIIDLIMFLVLAGVFLIMSRHATTQATRNATIILLVAVLLQLAKIIFILLNK